MNAEKPDSEESQKPTTGSTFLRLLKTEIRVNLRPRSQTKRTTSSATVGKFCEHGRIVAGEHQIDG